MSYAIQRNLLRHNNLNATWWCRHGSAYAAHLLCHYPSCLSHVLRILSGGTQRFDIIDAETNSKSCGTIDPQVGKSTCCTRTRYPYSSCTHVLVHVLDDMKSLAVLGLYMTERARLPNKNRSLVLPLRSFCRRLQWTIGSWYEILRWLSAVQSLDAVSWTPIARCSAETCRVSITTRRWPSARMCSHRR